VTKHWTELVISLLNYNS